MDDSLVVEASGGVMTLKLNRPVKRNAIDGAVLDGLEMALHDARRDPDVRVVVLRGAGGFFSAGIDLPFAEATELDALTFMRWVGRVVVALHQLPKPTISVVEGGAYGLGCNLALACDLTVAADDAVLCQAFTALGLSLDGGGAWLLPRIVGLKKAKELTFFAEALPARDALALGLVNRVVPAPEIDAFVADWASRLAAGPSTALSLTKGLLNDGYACSFEQVVEQESRSQTISVARVPRRSDRSGTSSEPSTEAAPFP